MKQPKTTYYRELLAACRVEMELLGYAKETAKLSGAGELLGWLEERGKLMLDQVERADMAEYLAYLTTRPKRNGGGSLSPYTVAGYVFSIKLLFDYAERYGLQGRQSVNGPGVAGLAATEPLRGHGRRDRKAVPGGGGR